MANPKELVKRRKAIRNIRKITRTMELIATGRYKKAMDRAMQAEAFTRKIGELAADLTRTAKDVTHPLLQAREKVKTVKVLILTSNRGLCGGYNGAILREASHRIHALKAQGVDISLEVSGKRGVTYCRFQGWKTDAQYLQFEDKPQFAEVDEIASRYLQDFISGKIDRVDVAWMKFINASRQTPVVESLLPLSSIAPAAGAVKEPAKQENVEYEFMPDAGGILQELLPMSFKVRLFKCFLDAAVSEQIARRVTMKSATENADEMIKMISSQYNRARQAQITKEISEIVGGAEALK